MKSRKSDRKMFKEKVKVVKTTRKEVKKMLKLAKNKKGFTLVELLIVIVILGILAAIVIARFAGATKESKEANLKGNLRTIRAAIEMFKANSKSNSYPPTVNDLVAGTLTDVDNKTFMERTPIDPFYRANATAFTNGTLSPSETGTDRDSKIDGGGGWAYDSANGRICVNYKSTDTVPGAPIDTSWGTAYNVW
jgi:prepilin-type N-terminal cleavage/methylation domain-containing protein